MVDFVRADLMAAAPRVGAGSVAKEPLNWVCWDQLGHSGKKPDDEGLKRWLTLPVGVLAALRM